MSIERSQEGPKNSTASSPRYHSSYNPYLHQPADNGIDLGELWDTVWSGKWVIGAITTLFAVGSVLLALALPNEYKSEALLAPSEGSEVGGISRMAGQLGGLASLAGINIGSGGDGKIAEAIAVLQSRQFITRILDKYNLLPELLAVDYWDHTTNKLILDSSMYDSVDKKWIREVKPPQTQTPSHWEAYKRFMELLTVSQDKDTGFVTVAVTHQSPYIAERWVKMLVQEINDVMKEKDMTEAQRSIKYLQDQLDSVALAGMRTVFYQLIEEQTKTIMLAEVRREYIFTTIDPPVVAEEKFKPKRALICIIGVVIGCLIAIVFLFIKNYISERKAEVR